MANNLYFESVIRGEAVKRTASWLPKTRVREILGGHRARRTRTFVMIIIVGAMELDHL
jgi:hypothetical protein